MKSADQRLAESDPTHASPYTPASYDAMIQRITSSPYPKTATTWRGFKVKMASSVAAASLLTALGITALNTVGSALPVLGFAAASTQRSFSLDGTVAAPSTLMRLNTNYQFTGAENFSTQASSGEAYTLVAPGDAVATLAQLAAVLKVDVGVATSTDNGQSFTATGPRYTGWLVVNGGYFAWGVDYTLNALSPSTPLSVEQLKARALSLAHQLGGFDLGPATIDNLSSDPLSPVSISVPIVVGGVTSDLAYSFTFAHDGQLIGANGQSFSLQPAGSYPLTSPSGAVSEITAQMGVAHGLMSAMGAGGLASSSSGATSSTPGPAVSSSDPTTSTLPPGVNVAPPATGPGGPITTVVPGPGTPDTVPIDTTPTTIPVPTIVHLTDVSTQYGFFAMSDGTTTLLPIYVYVGNVAGDTSYQLTFQVVPIDPSLINLSSVRPSIY